VAVTLLAQLSDPHVQADGGNPLGAQRLEAAVRAVLALRPLPDAVLVSGDLTEHGTSAEFARVAELLAPLTMPVHLLPGNHDDRTTMRAAFDVPGTGDEPVNYAVAVGGLRLVVADTTVPGRDTGRLGAEDLRWLADTLAAEPDTPTIVATHHPPILIGIDPLDELGMTAAEREDFAAVLAGAPQVKRVVTGHVHRGAFAVVSGVPVFTSPSTYLQGKLEIGPGELVLIDQPPAFALHVDLDGQLVTHVQPVEL
jgi:3',5'-cyclic-AMP phosphodiesterase